MELFSIRIQRTFQLVSTQQIPVFFHNTTILIVSYCKGKQGTGQKVSEHILNI